MRQLHGQIQELLDGIDSKEPFTSCQEVFNILSKAISVRALDGTQPPVLWEAVAFGFYCPTLRGIDPRQEYFRPMFVLQDSDGTNSRFPDISSITKDAVEYWGSRALASKSNLLMARYADLVWHFAPHVGWHGDRSSFARRAITSYFSMAQARSDASVFDILHRALHLAMLIQDEALTEQARDRLLLAEKQHGVTAQLGTWGICFETLVEPKKVGLTEEQIAEVIQDLEHRLLEVSEVTRPQFNPWGAQRAARLLARHYRRLGRDDQSKRVLMVYRDAFVAHVRAGPAMTAVGQLNLVYRDLKAFGCTDGIEELERTIRAYGEVGKVELGVFSHEMSIPVTDVESHLSRLVAGSLEESCVRIAREFVPSVREAKKTMAEIQENSPMYAMIPISKMTPDGRSEASIGGTAADAEGRLVQHISQVTKFTTMWLNLANERLFAEFVEQPESLANYIGGSPLFRPSDQLTLISSIHAYLRREFVLCVSALIPIVENAMRRLAEYVGASTMKQVRGGGQHLRNLDELLSDEKVVGFLGEDVSVYLRTILTDQRGDWNVRNNVCHGIIPGEQISASYANRVLHVCLVIALIRGRQNSDGPVGSQPENSNAVAPEASTSAAAMA
jgi:hypothetical protein